MNSTPGPIVRLVVSVAFAAGAAGFIGVSAPILTGVFVDYVPVLPVALVTVMAAALFGGVAAAAASQRWWGFLLALCLGTGAAFGASLLGSALVHTTAQGSLAWGVQTLDSDEFKAARTRWDGYNARGKMVATTILSGRLHGLSTDEVRGLLGEPDCPALENTRSSDGWSIGSWTGFQLDPNCLEVEYDRSGIAVGTFVTPL